MRWLPGRHSARHTACSRFNHGRTSKVLRQSGVIEGELGVVAHNHARSIDDDVVGYVRQRKRPDLLLICDSAVMCIFYWLPKRAGGVHAFNVEHDHVDAVMRSGELVHLGRGRRAARSPARVKVEHCRLTIRNEL